LEVGVILEEEVTMAPVDGKWGGGQGKKSSDGAEGSLRDVPHLAELNSEADCVEVEVEGRSGKIRKTKTKKIEQLPGARKKME